MRARRERVWLFATILLACSSDGGPGDGMHGPCLEPFTMCGSDCTTTQSDPAHCGDCGRTCPGGMLCSRGQCVDSCVSGLKTCSGACVDVASDPANCGDCGVACEDGRVCEGGECTCPRAECDGVCVNSDTDPENCGLCGRTCEDEQICNMGRCECTTGVRETDCNNLADDDCDDLTDCDDPDCDEATRPCDAECGAGVETCAYDAAGGTWSGCAAGDGGEEICGDGIDQNCDGQDLRNPDDYETNDTCSICTFLSEVDPNITIADARFDSVDDDVDCFYFNALDNIGFTNEYVLLNLQQIPFGHNYDLELYRDGCESAPIARSNEASNGNEHIEWEENSWNDGGTYYVVVRRVTGTSCEEDDNYSLTINGLDYLGE